MDIDKWTSMCMAWRQLIEIEVEGKKDFKVPKARKKVKRT